MKKCLFNEGWSFHSDIDRSEKPITLPHDAMLTEKRIPELPSGWNTGYYPGGVYTYFKTFTLTEKEATHVAFLEFGGIYQKSTIFINDEEVGGRVYGYSDFLVDITNKIRPGENRIRVIADNSQYPNSRWYSGSGIYRDVYYLSSDSDCYIKPDGIRADTISLNPVTIRVHTDAVLNDATVHVKIKKDGITIAEADGIDVTLQVEDAKLWSAESPELYTITGVVVRDNEILDEESIRFGIRMLSCDPQKGFMVNERSVKLSGGCVHHDNGALGAADYRVAAVRKVQTMKKIGFNAVRISHHPASQTFLEVCDEEGLYVVNEAFDTWLMLKNPYDYAMYFDKESDKDIRDMIRVAYNHPSVIMYAIGNEVALKDKSSEEITKRLVGICKTEDPLRMVLNCINPLTALMGNAKSPEKEADKIVDPRQGGKSNGAVGSALANAMVTYLPFLMKVFGNEKNMRKLNHVMEPLDAVGFNYADYLYQSQHEDYPNRILIGSETFPQNLGIRWDMIKKEPYIIGDFLWTAWAYLGEAGLGIPTYDKKASTTMPFPAIGAGVGCIDLIGDISCQGYYSAIVFGARKEPYIAVHPLNHAGEKLDLGQWTFTDALHSWSWNGYEGKIAMVDVYSNADYVELFLNERSLGRKKVSNYQATFEIPYQSGELCAKNIDSYGNIVGVDRVVSAGGAKRIKAEPEADSIKTDKQDLVFIRVVITDDDNIPVLLSDREVSVSVEGAAELVAVGSGDLMQKYDYTGSVMRTYNGNMLAVIRSNGKSGEVKVTFSPEGMDTQMIILNA